MTTKSNLAQPTVGSLGWGPTLNANFSVTDKTAGGVVAINATSNYALNTSESQNITIIASNSSGGTRSIGTNSVTGSWIVYNQSASYLNVHATNSYTGAYVSVYPFTNVFVNSPDGANMYQTPDNYVYRTGDTMTGALVLPSNGLNVGAGQLQVSGGSVFSTGSFQANANVTALSDERVKDDIETIEDALEKVKALRGVRYIRKDIGGQHIGVISQEVQKILPEVITESDDGMLHVAYGNIIGVLINAIKELAEKVEKLEG